MRGKLSGGVIRDSCKVRGGVSCGVIGHSCSSRVRGPLVTVLK